jgi:hypothetical protein
LQAARPEKESGRLAGLQAVTTPASADKIQESGRFPVKSLRKDKFPASAAE